MHRDDDLHQHHHHYITFALFFYYALYICLIVRTFKSLKLEFLSKNSLRDDNFFAHSSCFPENYLNKFKAHQMDIRRCR